MRSLDVYFFGKSGGLFSFFFSFLNEIGYTWVAYAIVQTILLVFDDVVEIDLQVAFRHFIEF